MDPFRARLFIPGRGLASTIPRRPGRRATHRLRPLVVGLALALAMQGEASAESDGGDYPAVISHDKPMIGVFPGAVPPEIATREGLPPNTGVLVLGTIHGSAADQMGIVSGDVILRLNGHPVSNYDEIVAARDQFSAGDSADIEFSHGGQVKTASAPFSTWPSGVSQFRPQRTRDPQPSEQAQQAQLAKLRDQLAQAKRDAERFDPKDDDARHRVDELEQAVADAAWTLTFSIGAPEVASSAPIGASADPSPAVSQPSSQPTAPGWRLEWQGGSLH